MSNIRSLAVFLILAIGGGILIGTMTSPGEWHAALIKPSFNPPNWVFGPVWTVLYIFIGIAGWRIWRSNPGGLTVKIWAAQMVLNFVWSPLFFSAHRIDIAFGVILILLAMILLFIAKTWRQDRLAAVLFLPYAVWLGFASSLNGSFLYLNGATGG
jgi:benzodiazapine receptor